MINRWIGLTYSTKYKVMDHFFYYYYTTQHAYI